MCFEKAGEEMWERNAKASGLRADADRRRGLNFEEAAIMLRKAAEIFDSIDKVDFAAECFCELGDYERAGTLCIHNHRHEWHEKSHYKILLKAILSAFLMFNSLKKKKSSRDHV